MNRPLHALAAVALLALVPLVPLACKSTAPATESPRQDASVVATSSPAEDAGPCTSPDFTGSPFGVHCNALVDTSGRTVLLHGLNARIAGIWDDTFTDGRLPDMTLPTFEASDAQRIRALGFNALRLPVNWSGIEPTEDGGVVSSYFDAVAAVTSMCAAAGVWVLIDLHQDAYSKEIGYDGAPLWAIQPPPTQLLGGPASGGGRVQTPQVQAAYQTFFGDPGVGAYLRTRFATMAGELAARFANDPAVFGFETYNEPLATDAQLLAFNQQVIAAVRAAAPSKLVLFEPSATFDEIGEASLGNGSIGTGTAYAPHVYTLAFTQPDTPGVTISTYTAANLNALAEAQSWQAPLVITEFGYPPGSPNFDDWSLWQSQLQDEVLASSFFWVWKEYGTGSWGFYDFDDAGTATERPAVVAAMTRPRLEAAAGRLVSVAYDPTAPSLTVVFDGSAAVTAPNVVSIGAGAAVPAAQWKATCDGKSVATSGTDPLAIACGGSGGHTLVVSAN